MQGLRRRRSAARHQPPHPLSIRWHLSSRYRSTNGRRPLPSEYFRCFFSFLFPQCARVAAPAFARRQAQLVCRRGPADGRHALLHLFPIGPAPVSAPMVTPSPAVGPTSLALVAAEASSRSLGVVSSAGESPNRHAHSRVGRGGTPRRRGRRRVQVGGELAVCCRRRTGVGRGGVARHGRWRRRQRRRDWGTSRAVAGSAAATPYKTSRCLHVRCHPACTSSPARDNDHRPLFPSPPSPLHKLGDRLGASSPYLSAATHASLHAPSLHSPLSPHTPHHGVLRGLRLDVGPSAVGGSGAHPQRSPPVVAADYLPHPRPRGGVPCPEAPVYGVFPDAAPVLWTGWAGFWRPPVHPR